jgi:hypothetical protein
MELHTAHDGIRFAAKQVALDARLLLAQRGQARESGKLCFGVRRFGIDQILTI